ncbi:MAG: hypothetical protein AAFX44_04430, partial [Pseudomonadota bacterium]
RLIGTFFLVLHPPDGVSARCVVRVDLPTESPMLGAVFLEIGFEFLALGEAVRAAECRFGALDFG